MQFRNGWHRLTRVWGSNARDLDDELAFHFETKIDDLRAVGLSAEEAHRRAQEEFGDLRQIRESLVAIDRRIAQRRSRTEWLTRVAQDLRYTTRSLVRAPGFTLMVLTLLALGIGANAALFSFIDQLYIQTPAGVRDADHVHRLYVRDAGATSPRTLFNFPQLRALSEVAPAGMKIAGYSTRGLPPWQSTDPNRISAVYVVGDYFGVLGVQPTLGRLFTAEENAIGGLSLTAVISDDLWQKPYNQDPSVIGATIDIGAHRHQIIGVAAPGFRGVDVATVDAWLPQNSRGVLRGRSLTWYDEQYRFLTLRLIAHAQSPAVASLFDSRATGVIRKDIMGDSLSSTFLGPLVQARVAGAQTRDLETAKRLAAVAIAILIIACANVANLLLARASSRGREFAVRLSLGVSRARLMAQVVTESFLVGLASGVVSLGVGYAGTLFLRKLLFPYARIDASVMDVRTVVFTFAIAAVAGVLPAILPALQFSRPNLTSALKSGMRNAGRAQSRVRTSMLIAQVALTFVLLAGAAVFVKSVQKVQNIEAGFDSEQLLFAQVDWNPEIGDRGSEFSARLPELAERIREVPGVENVALSDGIALLQSNDGHVFVPGVDSAVTNGRKSHLRAVVEPEYFRVAGISLISGRVFNDDDRRGAEPVVIVSQPLAQRLWPLENAISKCLIVDTRISACRRVVGVVSPTRDYGIMEPAPTKFYLPMAQANATDRAEAVAVRVRPGHGDNVEAAITRIIAAQFGSAAMPSFESIGRRMEFEVQPWRTGAALFGAAGVFALLVAAVGVYSNMAYIVQQRRQEMGVRVALGASPTNIVTNVIAHGARVVAVGVGIGLAFAVALGKLVASLLYATAPRDPLMLVTAGVVMLVVSLAACFVPAWRASRVDPLSAMRAE